MLTNLPSGYVIVYGTNDSLVLSTNVGNVTTCAVTGLLPNTDYTFACFAFAGELQSDLSNKVKGTSPLERPKAPAGFAIGN